MTVVLLMLLAYGGVDQQQAGLLGNAWGTPFSRMRTVYDLREIERENERVTCSSNIRQLGKADIEECNLEFVRNRFSGAVILTIGRENSDRLLIYLREIFGKGVSADPTAISWTAGDVRISYDVDSYGDGYVYWYCLNYQ